MPHLVLTLTLLLGAAASVTTAATTTVPVPRLRALATTDSPLYRNATRQAPPTTNTTTTTPGDNSTTTSRPKGPLPAQGFNKPRPKATSMVHLTQVNQSSWVSPEGETWYTTEYWAANTAAQALCEVKLAIALAPGVHAEHVKVNSSFALAFEGGVDNSSSDDAASSSPSSMAKAAVQAALTFFMDMAAHELMATLHPPYTHELRVRESVDMGFVLRGADSALAQTGAARVVSARYCDGGVEEGENGGQPEEEFAPNAGGNGGSSQPAAATPSRPKYQPGGM